MQVIFDNMAAIVEHIRSGALRALGVIRLERSPQLPDVAVRGWGHLCAVYDERVWPLRLLQREPTRCVYAKTPLSFASSGILGADGSGRLTRGGLRVY